ncbi:MAG: Ldh family oxidoreductase [Bacteroidetes bacterium]|nr:Ldh family oxidoreductase [Bacteroidota bacterium]MCL5025033.1 Ldh family oxidoreductase [Chloroflexota bacterium]
MFSADLLRQVGAALFEAAGAPPSIATQVAASMVENNLVGRDSHGVIRIPPYVARVKSGRIKGVPPAPGFDEVMVPGEPELRTRQQRLREGIPLADDT